jgi:hypothetical protein
MRALIYLVAMMGCLVGTEASPQGIRGGNACLPFGPGGYDYCANPLGTQPPGCHCNFPRNRVLAQAPTTYTRGPKGEFCLGSSSQGAIAVTQISEQQWLTLTARSRSVFINWDPFFSSLGRQAFTQWRQIVLKTQSSAATYGTQVDFTVSRQGVISNTSCVYGEEGSIVNSIVSGLKAPAFPAGSQLQIVPVIYNFTQTAGAATWTQVHFRELNGKLYKVNIITRVTS